MVQVVRACFLGLIRKATGEEAKVSQRVAAVARGNSRQRVLFLSFFCILLLCICVYKVSFVVLSQVCYACKAIVSLQDEVANP